VAGGSASRRRSADGLLAARSALVGRHKLRFVYETEGGATSDRTVRPLGVFFWGKKWTLAAWCETRSDFRNFRVDRMRGPAILDRFEDEAGKSLRDMIRRYGPEALKLLD
jgi:predicted DNA-binding transcriptional regulator YafY